MLNNVPGGILRAACHFASTIVSKRSATALIALWIGNVLMPVQSCFGQVVVNEAKSPERSNVLRSPATTRETGESAVAGRFAVTSTQRENASLKGFEARSLITHLWDFGRQNDVNFDGWPDDWVRTRGIGYPAYVKAEITARNIDLENRIGSLDALILKTWPKLREQMERLPIIRPLGNSPWQSLVDIIRTLPKSPPSITDRLVNRYFRIDLDGGQFRAQSPTILASRQYQYRFSCRIMTSSLRHDSARAEVLFVDDNDQPLVTLTTEPVGHSTKWTEVSIGPVRPPRGSTKMLVRLLVDRSEDGLEDINGMIGFDDVRIDQLPQLQLVTDRAHGLYRAGEPVLVSAKILGLPAGASRIRFELRNHDDRLVETDTRNLDTRRDQSQRSLLDGDNPSEPEGAEIRWQLAPPNPGFYRITALLDDEKQDSSNAREPAVEPSHPSVLATDTTIAVIDSLVQGPPQGSFGWTLPRGAANTPPRELADWLSTAGVAWLKYPCWVAPDDTKGAEHVAEVVGKLQDTGIQTVGMLDVPPESQIPRYDLRGRRDLVAALLFRDADIWQPELEPVMSRLSLKVNRWQLGADRDHSFLGRPRLRETISKISAGLQGFGQSLEMTICWPWLEPQLPSVDASWQAVCRSSDPPLSAKELDSFLEVNDRNPRADAPRTWMLIDPIRSENYDRDARITDLVLRMATVRSHRVEAAFISDPYDPSQGLLSRDGRPEELFMPWRTTARLIGDLRNVGSIYMRSGARNMVFAGSDRAVMVVWSDQPTEERIYLGSDVKAVDVWGRVTNLPAEVEGTQPSQRLSIGRTPTFIVGVNPTLMALRMSVELEPNRLDSLLGQKQKLTVFMTNPTAESLVGEMRMIPPDTWSVEQPLWRWELLPARSTSHSFSVMLGNTAKMGEYEIPIQFDLDSSPPTRISVYRTVKVGPTGIELNATTRLLTGNELLVRVEATNSSQVRQSYECMLFPPAGRQYQSRYLTVNPGETVRRDFYWPRGEELIGERMLLRAAEQEGERILNYEIIARR